MNFGRRGAASGGALAPEPQRATRRMGAGLLPCIVISAESLAPSPLQFAAAPLHAARFFFWGYAATQLAHQLRQERSQVVCSDEPHSFSNQFPDMGKNFLPWDSRKNPVPTMKFNCGKYIYTFSWFGIHRLARQLHQ